MRLLCQNIATRANREDEEVGRFWQSRFRAVRLLDEAAIVACAAYVDLNPIRAAVADSLKTSDYTSVQRRIQSRSAESDAKKPSTKPDGFLSPVPEKPVAASKPDLGPVPSRTGVRCSDKGFLPMSEEAYLTLLDWTGRQLHRGSRGRIPVNCELVLKQLGLDRRTWCELVAQFGKLFIHVAGRPRTIDASRSKLGQHRYHLRAKARSLLSEDVAA